MRVPLAAGRFVRQNESGGELLDRPSIAKLTTIIFGPRRTPYTPTAAVSVIGPVNSAVT